MPPRSTRPIHIDQTVREVSDRYPSTRPIFARYGLNAFCGGNHTLGPAALARGLEPATLLAELNAPIESDCVLRGRRDGEDRHRGVPQGPLHGRAEHDVG